jgi:hypothetical protein
MNKQKYIENVIDEEISVSLLFGLEIKSSDILIEKTTISNSIISHWDDIINGNYNSTMFDVNEKVFYELREQFNYYFDNTPSNEVKTKYNCHIQAIISRLFLEISNNLTK